MPIDLQDLKNEWSNIEQRFSKFVQFRGQDGTWAKIIRREFPVRLQPELEEFREGFDYQSPLVEKYIHDHVDVLHNPTLFDLHTTDDSRAGRDVQRALLLWTARVWDQLNDGGWWDSATGEGQTWAGADASWLRWKPAKLVKGEDGQEVAEKERANPFYLEHCDIGGVRWVGNPLDPDAVYYRYTVPVVESGLRKEGKRLTVDSLDQLGWLGEHEAHDSSTYGKSVDVLVRDARDLAGRLCPCEGCDHVMRTITVQVSVKGQAVDKGEIVEEMDSPFHHSSFFITPSRQSFRETDPHLQMRPLIAALYPLVNFENYITVVLAAMARGDYSNKNLYESLANVTPQATIAREGGNAGQDQAEDDGFFEIPLRAGQVLRLPKNISDHLMALRQDVQRLIAECAPNRYLQATASTEASNATGTAFLQQAQAASLPYNRLLTMSDRTIRRIFEAIFHAIKYWGYEEPEGYPTKYVALLTGGENVLRYKSTIKVGEPISITAKDASSAFDLVVKTESRTLTEQIENWRLAVDKYEKNVFTRHDLMRAGGIFDVVGQDELLFRDQVRHQHLEPYTQKLVADTVMRMAEVISDFDFSASVAGVGAGAANGGANYGTASQGEDKPILPRPFSNQAYSSNKVAQSIVPFTSGPGATTPVVTP